MTDLSKPSPDDLADPGFVTAQAFTWARGILRLYIRDEMRVRDPEAAKRLLAAVNSGNAHIEARLDFSARTATFYVHLDNGEALELCAAVPAPRLPPK